ncbi:hypothetical protein [Massilia sp. CF038]|uniref:hypothetical protein n=1 Tax=Massilia sp. CF038 TaxID=1881045 RepID=UPI0009145E90|nr:hypothetical protein [Massilia sp. CF038]SHH14094.1 hypothetical protein SAMN05428948_2990 [Massilia sp. CF038]
MNPRHIALGVALTAAAALVLFGDNRPATGVVEAVERAPAPAPAAVKAAAPAAARTVTPASTEPAILRLQPRERLIGSEDEAMGAPGDLFGRRDWNPPPPAPDARALAAAAAAAPPPPAPMAPPLPFTFLGKAVADGNWEVFLARGDKTYIVRDKMVIEGTYRVDAITPPNLTLTYLPLNQVQQLNIGVLD